MASGRSMARKSSWESSIFDETGINTNHERDRSELHFSPQAGSPRVPYGSDATGPPSQVSLPFPSHAHETRTPAAGNGSAPERPLRMPTRRSTTPTLIVHQRIARKPVARASISEGSSSRPNPEAISRMPTNAASTLGSQTLRSPSSTQDLFAQASYSLQNLADSQTVQLQDEQQPCPPPYSLPPDIPPRDAKQRNSVASYDVPGSEDIFQMIFENRIEAVQKLLEAGIGIDEIDPDGGRTAIMYAANLRRVRLCQMLLQAGCRLHLKDPDQNTALHYAAYQGDVDICRLLLESGAQLEECNRQGKTPLMIAAFGGHTQALDCLLNCWAAEGGHAAALTSGFLEATKSCNIATARAFIDRGIKPKKLKEPWKPIAYAAISGSTSMIDFLVAHRCNIKDRSPDGWTALHHAAYHGQTAMVEKLLAWKLSWKASTKKDDETALHLSIRAGHTATSLALIHHKDSNISVKDADAQQPIHHATRVGDVQVTTALLEKGAKLDEQNDFGYTPVLIAAAYGHLGLMAQFITRSANTEAKLGSPDIKPAKMTNAIAKKGYWAEIRWPHAGARPLHLAIEFGHDEVANMLLSNGVKIDEPDSKSWRPLHYAAFHGRLRMVEVLLGRGASPNASTSEGNTPFSLGFREVQLTATREEKEQIAELLHDAMNARRKSKMRQLTRLVSAGGNKSRDAGERNRCWHIASLARTIYLQDELDEDDDSGTVLTPRASMHDQADDDDGADERSGASRAVAGPSSRAEKWS